MARLVSEVFDSMRVEEDMQEHPACDRLGDLVGVVGHYLPALWWSAPSTPEDIEAVVDMLMRHEIPTF